MDKTFWKATGIRCIRTFLSTILGVWTVGTLITDVDWKGTLLSAFSTTVFIFIACIVAGLPEVKWEHEQYMNIEPPEDAEVSEDDD